MVVVVGVAHLHAPEAMPASVSFALCLSAILLLFSAVLGIIGAYCPLVVVSEPSVGKKVALVMLFIAVVMVSFLLNEGS